MKKTKINIKAVIFDMDGVITNSMPEHYQSWEKVLKEEGIPISKQEIYQREGQPGNQTVKELFALNGLPYTKIKGREILQRKESYFTRIIKTRFIDGARALLKKLHNESFSLALVTGTAREEVHKILPDEVYDLFDVVVTGSDVKKGKPDPEPFLRALKELHLNAAECLVIENAPFGIRSAQSASLKCIAIETSLSREYLQEADYVFASLKDMQDNVQLQWIEDDALCP